jgi:hypothetical protein
MKAAGAVLGCVLGLGALGCGPDDSVVRTGPAVDRDAAANPDGAAAGDAAEAGGAQNQDGPPLRADGAPETGDASGAMPGDAGVAGPSNIAPIADASPADNSPPDVVADGPPAPGTDMASAPDAGERVGCRAGSCRRIFLTSAGLPNGAIGSVAAADATCQRLATAAALGGLWRAWLSDANVAPATRFSRATVPYRLLDGNRVAVNWAALTSGALEHAIDVFETGQVAGRPFEVWTGTLTSGLGSNATCGNWTNNSIGLPAGTVGLSNRADGTWTRSWDQFCNRPDVHLYCFEQ